VTAYRHYRLTMPFVGLYPLVRFHCVALRPSALVEQYNVGCLDKSPLKVVVDLGARLTEAGLAPAGVGDGATGNNTAYAYANSMGGYAYSNTDIETGAGAETPAVGFYYDVYTSGDSFAFAWLFVPGSNNIVGFTYTNAGSANAYADVEVDGSATPHCSRHRDAAWLEAWLSQQPHTLNKPRAHNPSGLSLMSLLFAIPPAKIAS